MLFRLKALQILERESSITCAEECLSVRSRWTISFLPSPPIINPNPLPVLSAVSHAVRRAFKEWKTNVEYVTELALVLNHKIWQHYRAHTQLADRYDTLWRQCDVWCADNLKGNALGYYYQTID